MMFSAGWPQIVLTVIAVTAIIAREGNYRATVSRNTRDISWLKTRVRWLELQASKAGWEIRVSDERDDP